MSTEEVVGSDEFLPIQEHGCPVLGAEVIEQEGVVHDL